MEELKAKLHHNKQAAAASGQVPGRARNERHESSPHAHETIGGVRALSADDPLGHRVEAERVTARTARSCRSRRDVEVSVRTERDAERVVLDRRAPEDVLPTGTQIDPNDVAVGFWTNAEPFSATKAMLPFTATPSGEECAGNRPPHASKARFAGKSRQDATTTGVR